MVRSAHHAGGAPSRKRMKPSDRVDAAKKDPPPSSATKQVSVLVVGDSVAKLIAFAGARDEESQGAGVVYRDLHTENSATSEMIATSLKRLERNGSLRERLGSVGGDDDDVVLLHIGTNDACEATVENIRACIAMLQRNCRAPNVRMVVCLPFAAGPKSAERVRGVAAAIEGAFASCMLVPMTTDEDRRAHPDGAHYPDGLHPTEEFLRRRVLPRIRACAAPRAPSPPPPLLSFYDRVCALVHTKTQHYTTGTRAKMLYHFDALARLVPSSELVQWVRNGEWTSSHPMVRKIVGQCRVYRTATKVNTSMGQIQKLVREHDLTDAAATENACRDAATGGASTPPPSHRLAATIAAKRDAVARARAHVAKLRDALADAEKAEHDAIADLVQCVGA